MRDNDPASSQHILDHPQVERGPETKPHRVGDDFRGKAMTAIKQITVRHDL
ncbi:hypothetical protein GA0061101_1175 [Rhizobium lusitanum]|jgi:hypothetical protein|uniref:Uncharacterized protein n=1 Tax=Rhizobium lusitanum TaxID=293958 RepID=A0A1C3WTJ1_9HYPH|nr:hypothetical protein GA0061101_1175 [Rhizobium lusitanum]